MYRWASVRGKRGNCRNSSEPQSLKEGYAVYVFASSQSAIDNLKPSPVVLPKTVLSRIQLFREKGGLPDEPIRASLKIAGGDEKILELLRTRMGLLLVNANEFKYWYRSERAKGKWPSQRSKLKRREGRPSKQTDTLRKAVITAMQKKTSIAELRRRLVASGKTDVPSVDTLERL